MTGKRLLGRTIIGTNSKHLRPGLLKMLHTSLVRFHLGRSTTRKGGREEREHDGALPEVIAYVHCPAIRRRKREIRRFVPYLQCRRRWRCRLCGETNSEPARNHNPPGYWHSFQSLNKNSTTKPLLYPFPCQTGFPVVSMLNTFQSIMIMVCTVAGSVAFLLLLQRVWTSEQRRPHNDLIGWHVSVLGTTYAVIIGFMLFAVWTNFETAEADAEAEANCLVNLVRSSRGLPASQREQVGVLASEYVGIMLNHEWAAMSRGQISPASHRVIQQLWTTITGIETHTAREQISLDHTLTELSSMTEHRRRRELQVDSYLPDILWLVLIVGAIVTLVSACLFGTVDLKLHLVQVIMLSSLLSAVLVAIADINRPFQGSVHVTPVGFERASVLIGDIR